ncbi:hypothetical protein SAMN06265338_13019 [Rhodoblastus acidophilus]|uniref:Uncharacterized protein n=1 Tax=Rhodoblastus acidophilus TaxID=1074 RepID=A0A212SDX4_RHOAC|nr:hypothetical protein [Rhodoblastus acidophilus]PPQ34976.1 hypothetical protein CKO16_21440 [Rhodoblastus acidophilus]RAI16820.1 hypothetical protein CH337_19480 [Rhodoblastus acidophilus]SNB83824.1 hypothetical protein SAMN06265338_13019 [Rhodoblastus acidophilus]
MTLTADHVEQIIQRYAINEDDAAILRAQAGAGAPRWSRRQDRLENRDEAIRTALRRFYADLPSYAAAQAFSRDLDRILASCWQMDVGTDVSSINAKRAALVEVAKQNEGRSLGWRQVLNIVDGARGG